MNIDVKADYKLPSYPCNDASYGTLTLKGHNTQHSGHMGQNFKLKKQ